MPSPSGSGDKLHTAQGKGLLELLQPATSSAKNVAMQLAVSRQLNDVCKVTVILGKQLARIYIDVEIEKLPLLI